jgi:hypothetical protein
MAKNEFIETDVELIGDHAVIGPGAAKGDSSRKG